MLESPPAPSAKASESQGAFLVLNPRGRSQGYLPWEIWTVGSQLSQLSLCPCMTQRCVSCPQHEQPTEKHSHFQRNSCWRHCCSLPCFPVPAPGCSLPSARYSWLVLCMLEPRNPQLQDDFLATGMLARWGNALCCAGGAAWPGAVGLSRQAQVGMKELQGWAKVMLPHFVPRRGECQVHKSE